MKVKVYNLNKKAEQGDIVIDITPPAVSFAVNHAVYLVAKYQSNSRRVGSASTKTRSTVSGGGSKPFKQKGTGRARQGTSRSPLKPGGAVSHGPQPRSFSHKLNAQLVKNAFSQVFYDKLNVMTFADYDAKSDINVKDVQALLVKNGSPSRVVVLVEAENSPLYLASRNITACRCFSLNSVDIKDLYNADLIVVDYSSANYFERFKS